MAVNASARPFNTSGDVCASMWAPPVQVHAVGVLATIGVPINRGLVKRAVDECVAVLTKNSYTKLKTKVRSVRPSCTHVRVCGGLLSQSRAHRAHVHCGAPSLSVNTVYVTSVMITCHAAHTHCGTPPLSLITAHLACHSDDEVVCDQTKLTMQGTTADIAMLWKGVAQARVGQRPMELLHVLSDLTLGRIDELSGKQVQVGTDMNHTIHTHTHKYIHSLLCPMQTHTCTAHLCSK